MKISFTKTIAYTAVAAVLVISACNNSPYPGYELSETSNVYSKFYKHDEKGVKPKEGDLIRLVLQFKNSKDSVIFNSKKVNPNGQNYIEFRIPKSTFKGCFEDALQTMSLGDSASFLINADSFFCKTNNAKELPKFIEKGSMLTFEAKLEKITSKEEVEKEQKKRMEEEKVMTELRKNEEPKMLAKYLADNKITTKPTASGLYFIEKTKGKGPKPVMGDVVRVNYTGHLLDGTIFDTSDEAEAKKAGTYDNKRQYGPIEFQVGQVIEGWNEALSLMSEGSKVQLIIPSSIGYGERGAGPIPPFTSLVFDVELVSFTHAKK